MVHMVPNRLSRWFSFAGFRASLLLSAAVVCGSLCTASADEKPRPSGSKPAVKAPAKPSTKTTKPSAKVPETDLQIIPAAKVPVGGFPSPSAAKTSVKTATATQTTLGAKESAASYQQIYRSIPFNRALYNANPNYRHDATMELLTGQSRTQTVNLQGQSQTDRDIRLSP
jgi:hypothetical protein